MDFPFSTPHHPRARGPVAAWMLMALIVIVLGVAALAGSTMSDTRDFAARHGTVLGTSAL